MNLKTELSGLPSRKLGEMELTSLPTFGQLDAISLFRVSVPAGQGTISIVHRLTDEMSHVLSGEGMADIGGRRFPVKAGDVIHIPKGLPHAFEATTPAGLEVICLFAPALDPKSPDVEVI